MMLLDELFPAMLNSLGAQKIKVRNYNGSGWRNGQKKPRQRRGLKFSKGGISRGGVQCTIAV
jgi:hypothetical protein